MKKYALILLNLGLIFTLSIISCEETPSDLSHLYNITVLNNEYDSDSYYDFGLTEAEGAGKSVTLVLTNSGDADITISELTLSDNLNYSLTAPELPATAASGDTAEVSITFMPLSSGVFTTTVNITVEDFPSPFTMNLTGEGNYPPSLSFGITVAGAGDPEANGFYLRDGFKDGENFRRPLYTKSGTTDYHCYIWDDGDDDSWCIHDSLLAEYPEEPIYEADSREMLPPETGWNTAQPPTVTRGDITGTDAYTHQELTANYLYSDADGDAEDTDLTVFQWYKADDEEGPYEAISQANSKTYLPTNDEGRYLKVEVIPVAAAGIPTGASVLSSPTVEIVIED